MAFNLSEPVLLVTKLENYLLPFKPTTWLRRDGTFRLAPTARLRNSTSARSKKLTKKKSFKALTVEDSDSNDTNFIDDESLPESDGDSNISIISNGEVCFSTS